MYFDIDSTEQISEFYLYKAKKTIISKLIYVKLKPKIHTCIATTDKYDINK